MAVAEREQEQNAERITRLRQGRDQTHTFYSQVEIGAHQRQQRLRVVNRGDAKAGAECENEDNPACVAGGKGSRCHVQCLIDAMGLFFPERDWRGSRAGGKTVIRSTYRQKENEKTRAYRPH